jgi:putative transposase
MAMHKLSQRRACGLSGISRRAYQFTARADRNLELRKRLRELAEEKRRWGCPLLCQSLKRAGFAADHQRVERLYREEGLSRRRKRRRKKLSYVRVTLPPAERANQVWALDFVHDSLLSGRRFRALTIIDQWSRECPAIEVDTSLTGARVTRVLEQLKATRGLPGTLQSDHGAEFTRRVDGSVGE